MPRTKTKQIFPKKKLKLIAIAIVVLLILVAITTLILQASSKSFVVSADGKGRYKSIQQAINDASPGDTIYVKRGEYSEKLIINKNIVLMGEDRNSVLLKGNGSKDLNYIGISIQASGVTLDGLNIWGFGTGVYVNTGANRIRITNCMITNVTRGVSAFGNDTEISNNILAATDEFGIYIATSNNNKITNNIITNTTANRHTAIRLLGSEGTIISNNSLSNGATGVYCTETSATITSNTISNYTQGMFDLMVKNTITKNVIKTCGIGIGLDSATNCLVSENLITGGNKAVGFMGSPIGVYLRAYSKIDYTNKNNQIIKNTISESGIGIKLHGSNEANTISGNLIENNNEGINFEDLYDSYQYYRVNKGNTVTKNTITSNAIGINFIVTSTVPGINAISYDRGNTISNNNIMKNPTSGIEALDEKMLISAQSNYWGASSGPKSAINPLGGGDQVTINVDFLNWLKSEEKIDAPEIPAPVISNYTITRNFQSGFLAGFDIPIVLLTVCLCMFVITRVHNKKTSRQ